MSFLAWNLSEIVALCKNHNRKCTPGEKTQFWGGVWGTISKTVTKFFIFTFISIFSLIDTFVMIKKWDTSGVFVLFSKRVDTNFFFLKHFYFVAIHVQIATKLLPPPAPPIQWWRFAPKLKVPGHAFAKLRFFCRRATKRFHASQRLDNLYHHCMGGAGGTKVLSLTVQSKANLCKIILK